MNAIQRSRLGLFARCRASLAYSLILSLLPSIVLASELPARWQRYFAAVRVELEKCTALLSEGKVTEALAKYEAIIQTRPNDKVWKATVLEMAGSGLESSGHQKEAIAVWERAARETDLPDAREHLGDFWSLQGKLEDSEKWYSGAIQLGSNTAGDKLAISKWATGDLEEAARVFAKRTTPRKDTDIDMVPAGRDLGIALIDETSDDELRRRLTNSVRIDGVPYEPRILDLRGLCRYPAPADRVEYLKRLFERFEAALFDFGQRAVCLRALAIYRTLSTEDREIVYTQTTGPRSKKIVDWLRSVIP